jgi:hypothetical protein
MKFNFFKPAAIIMFGFMVTASCSKEEANDQLPEQGMEQTISLSAFETYLNADLSEGMIHGDNVITIVDCENQIINQFTDDAKFREWSYSNGSLKSSPTQNIYELNSFLNSIVKIAEEQGYTESYEYGDELPVEIQSLVNTSPYFSQQGLKSAVSWVQLYDNINRRETLCTVNTTFLPKLRDEHCNKAESLYHYGNILTAYCDGTWFRGDKMYIIGIPFLAIDDLESFRNKFESIISAY